MRQELETGQSSKCEVRNDVQMELVWIVFEKRSNLRSGYVVETKAGALTWRFL